MRKLVIAAVTAAALAAPGTAAADTAPDATCVTPVIPCVQQTVGDAVNTTNAVIDEAQEAATTVVLEAQDTVAWVYQSLQCVNSCYPDLDSDTACYAVWGEPCPVRP